jgi:NAD(P)-dependent dehydrogenase (short-subunit alcohol dehydrogenase family)
MSKRLENKLALVTGSSRGIGAAIAVRLAATAGTGLVVTGYSIARRGQLRSCAEVVWSKYRQRRRLLDTPLKCAQRTHLPIKSDLYLVSVNPNETAARHLF